MGCAFDAFSTSWNHRSYIVTLFVVAWFIPLIVIFRTYNGIIHRVRHSFVGTMLFESGRMCYSVIDKSQSSIQIKQRVSVMVYYVLFLQLSHKLKKVF